MRKAVVTLVVGDKYSRLADKQRNMFASYAAKVDATLVEIREPLDPTFHRGLLSQKLLIPSVLRDFEAVAFCDLDILIPANSENIFDVLSNEKIHFSAVVDPRFTPGFEAVALHHWRLPHLTKETHRDYFISRGYSLDAQRDYFSVNGGVWVCRPNEVADIFENSYWGNEAELGATAHEEAIMAYVSQSAEIFGQLDPRFNTQFIFEVFKNRGENKLPLLDSLARLTERRLGRNLNLGSPWYRHEVGKLLASGAWVHFAGGLPFYKLIDSPLVSGSPNALTGKPFRGN